ncbi:MAG: iron chelate uptake ABC transporter family permease subunit [Bauldia sp.]|nr:iron chelate uptake ABC transporter family permease subunit [Bauldia sp.]
MATDRPAEGERGGLAHSNATRGFWLLVAIGAFVAVVLLSIGVGSRNIPLATVFDGLFHYADTDEHAIIQGLRLPRTVLGILCGIALGLSGALIQALTRNPLADPGILGVNAGATFFMVLGIGLFGFTTLSSLIWFAFAGAVVTTLVVYAIGSSGRGAATPVRLTLAGVAIGAILGGIGTGLTMIDPQTFNAMRHWVGSLASPNYPDIVTILPFWTVGVVLAIAAARPLNAVALGEDLAAALGASLVRTRVIVVVAVTLLAGSTAAIAGPIGFVGLMVPHVARWIVGPDQRWIIAFTIVLAPILLLVSDIVGRIAMRPGELQVGIVTAFVGAPVLILLARRRKASGL